MKSDYKISFKINNLLEEVDFINDTCNRNPNLKILVEIQNTKNITSSTIRQLAPNILIRIAGGYDDDRITKYINYYNEDGILMREHYYNAVIYTRNETIKILEEIEKIESDRNKNWSDIQKLIYIYDKLKTTIMYDPKYNQKKSTEINNLKGLITKKSICSGYSLILKEFMDRNDISCEYVEGISGKKKNNQYIGHAWNIVTIDGKKYPIDLTWENTLFRSGRSRSFDWFGQDILTFCKSHVPNKKEKTQNYEKRLSEINPNFINEVCSQMGIDRSKTYRTRTYFGTRKDDTKFIITQIGETTINNITYYRYHYMDVTTNIKNQNPIILYSDSNIAQLSNSIKFQKYFSPNYRNAIDNILFSKENINDSLMKNTCYIGNIKNNDLGNKIKLILSERKLLKPKDKCELFTDQTKIFTRTDGSKFIAQRMQNIPQNIIGNDIIKYDICEMVNEGGKDILKTNTIYTEKDFFQDNRKGIADDFLSRQRIDRKYKEAGGYIGYYDEDGFRKYNPDLVEFFETSKYFDLNALEFEFQGQIPEIKIPTFEELKDLASNYEIVTIQDDYSNKKTKIRNIKTSEIITNKSLIYKTIFANIWLSAAGTKYYPNESKIGITSAFNKYAEELYYKICNHLLNSCKENGIIDTKDLLKSLHNENTEIITELFLTKYRTQFINKLFLLSLGINKQCKVPANLNFLKDINNNGTFNSEEYNPKRK